MARPPRKRSENVITKPMLMRAWLFLGVISACLEMAGFFYVLLKAGWSPGDPVQKGDALHGAYLEATTMTSLLGTSPLHADDLLFVLPFPLIVWGADELRRWLLRPRVVHQPQA